MLKRLTFLPAAAFAVSLALPTVSSAEPSADTVVARVNDQEITLGHVIIAFASLPQQYQQVPPEQLYPAIINQLIQQSALEQEHEGDLPRHVALSLENERRSLLAGEKIENIMRDAVSDADIQAEYDSRYSDGVGGTEYNASHILVETQEEAAAIREEVIGGADFAKTAEEKSTGPSGPNGGSLGWFGEGAMVPEFEAAVVALEAGDVSEPVQTQFGWHVIKLNETRQADAPPLEEVQVEIATELRQKAVEKRIEELTNAANVERPEVEGFDPQMITDLEMIRN